MAANCCHSSISEKIVCDSDAHYWGKPLVSHVVSEGFVGPIANLLDIFPSSFLYAVTSLMSVTPPSIVTWSVHFHTPCHLVYCPSWIRPRSTNSLLSAFILVYDRCRWSPRTRTSLTPVALWCRRSIRPSLCCSASML